MLTSVLCLYITHTIIFHVAQIELGLQLYRLFILYMMKAEVFWECVDVCWWNSIWPPGQISHPLRKQVKMWNSFLFTPKKRSADHACLPRCSLCCDWFAKLWRGHYWQDWIVRVLTSLPVCLWKLLFCRRRVEVWRLWPTTSLLSLLI